ncbi:hypothetical protein PUN28_002973 [Cardiocondyla obscurior]|uniref:Uncharacterized protein n=1 Tax=Cardiocondyla obscurior TaxID=286306 RepID=A0AAW2GX55_9HYME
MTLHHAASAFPPFLPFNHSFKPRRRSASAERTGATLRETGETTLIPRAKSANTAEQGIVTVCVFRLF